jgi:replicative DNA helicase
MSFGLGTKTLLSFCKQQDPLLWQKSKVTPVLFKPHEANLYGYIAEFLKKHHALPHVETLGLNFPDTIGIDVPEPPSYYLDRLEHAFYYSAINAANIGSQEILKANQDDYEPAMKLLKNALYSIMEQKQRTDLIDIGLEGAALAIKAYHDKMLTENICQFGWPYLDDQQGGVMPGDIVSFVGRPATGKTWLMLWIAIANWILGCKVLFVSMEMGKLPITQRIAAMYTHCPVSQLKTSAFSKHTYEMFVQNSVGMKGEKGKLYVVNGRLAATMDDIFTLADQLQCKVIVIDGCYLVRHHNTKLDRFNRVAENCEIMKTYTEDEECSTFASWQFNRDAVKDKKNGKQETKLEDIGYSDAIGQISSIACGMWQEDGVETMLKRNIRLMKGRNGEIGEFSVAWDFMQMNFKQVDPPLVGVKEEKQDLLYL